jgi:hypothetical protein
LNLRARPIAVAIAEAVPCRRWIGRWQSLRDTRRTRPRSQSRNQRSDRDFRLVAETTRARLKQAAGRNAAIQNRARSVAVPYDFEVLRGDEIIVAERLVVTGLGDIWSRIARVAEHVAEPGCLIRVTEEGGGIAILIGVTAARCLFHHPASRPEPDSRSM